MKGKVAPLIQYVNYFPASNEFMFCVEKATTSIQMKQQRSWKLKHKLMLK